MSNVGAGQLKPWRPAEIRQDYLFQPDLTRIPAGLLPGGKSVFARAVVHAERDEVKKLKIGYSDDAVVFLNGTPIYSGKVASVFVW